MPSVVIECDEDLLQTQFVDGSIDLMSVEMRLMRIVDKDNSASFEGNEIGGRSARLFIDCAKPSRIIRLLARQRIFSAWQATATYDDGTTISVKLCDSPDLTPFTDHEATLPRSRRPKPGDGYAIPLPNGRWGHAAFALLALPMGDCLQVLDLVTDEPASLEEMKLAGHKFPPITTSISVSARVGKWKYIGHWSGFLRDAPPPYRQSQKSGLRGVPGVFDDWTIFENNTLTLIGKLPARLRAIEVQAVWWPEEIALRIQTGKNPYDEWL